jgi:hypothetical protein
VCSTPEATNISSNENPFFLLKQVVMAYLNHITKQIRFFALLLSILEFKTRGSVNKHGRHRPFLFLIGRFLKIFFVTG